MSSDPLPSKASRRSTLAALARQQAVLEALLNQEELAVSVVDAQGHPLRTNGAVARLFGQQPPPEYCLFTDPVLAEQGLTEAVARVRQGEPVVLPDVWYNIRDYDPSLPDQPVWVRTRLIPVLGGDGRIDRIVTLMEDMTAARQAEQAVRDSEVLYRTLFDGASDAMFILDLQGTILQANEQAARMYGYGREDLIGRSPADWAHPDCRALFDQYLQKLQAGEPFATESRDRRADGTLIDVELHATPIRVQGRDRVLAVVRDISERRRMLDALRRSEAQYRALFEAAGDPMGLMTPEGVLLEVNARSARLHGFSRQEMAGKPVRELIHPDQQQAIERHLAALQAGQSVWTETVAIDRQGRPIDVESRATPVEVAGEPRVLVILRDITERKRAEQVLAESERRLRLVLDASRDVIYRFSLVTGQFEYVSPSIQNVTRLSGAELEGWSWQELLDRIHPDDQAAVAATFQRLQGSPADPEASHTSEYRFLNGDGEYRWMSNSYTIVRDAEGRPVASVGNIRDITEQRRAREALAQSEQRFRTVLESSRDVIYQLDLATGRFDYISPSVQGMTGLPVEQTLGLGFDWAVQQVHPEDRPAIWKQAEQIRQGFGRDGRLLTLEYRFGHRNGQYRWYSDSHVPVYDELGQLVGVVGNVRDITQRREADEALRSAHRRLLSARDEERRRLAGELHDSVNQGLAVLQMDLQSLLQSAGADLPDAQRDLLVHASKQTTELISEVRTISQGLYPPALESLGLVAALRGLARSLESGPAELRVQAPSPFQSARLPAEFEIELFRIAQEAVQNALRHGQASRIAIRLNHQRGRVVLQVEDNGQGFDINAVESSGIGLRSMRDRAELLQGTLRIASRPGRTRVTASAPVELDWTG